MSSGKGFYWANKMLDIVLGAESFTPPANIYLALYNVTPGADGGGTEVSGPGYDRVLIPNNSTQWPAATGGRKANASAQYFPPASGLWGVIVGAALLDAPTGGNLLYFGSLTQARTVTDGDTAQFPAGSIAITET